MKILFTGNGTSGSFQIRGVQLGNACGATVIPKATRQDIKRCDVVVVVKRISEQLLNDIRSSGKPWIYDIIDAYPQPECTAWDRKKAIDWVQTRLKILHPNAVIWPNNCMMYDCDMGMPGMVLYHHHLPGIAINTIKKDISVIGYEGSRDYIGKWLGPILKECIKRKWEFKINTRQLADMDIVIAVRDDHVNGYAQSHWKSNVKLANAHGSGTPFIGPHERGYIETSTGFEMWADYPEDLSQSFDRLRTQELRQKIQNVFLHNKITVDDCAKQLIGFIDGM
jgi:hypothetical protein